MLAVAALASCMKEQTIETMQPGTIAFDGAFVDNATRANSAADPSTTTETIEGFTVWGFMDEATGKVFEAEKVTRNGSSWTYVNTQYWAPGHTYYFAALSNHKNAEVTATGTNKLGLGTVKYTVTDGAEDLLYAAAGPIDAPAANATTVDPVKFAFNHMLSKVKFTFKNGFTNSLATIDVKNIEMVVPATATIDLDVADWWSTNCWTGYTGTKTVAFGDACAMTAIGVSQECDNERIILPADATQSYEVTFDVVLYQGEVAAYTGTKTVKIEGVALEMGKAYNFTAELNASNLSADGSELLPIVFDVEEVKDWVEADAQTGVIAGAITSQTLMADAKATATVQLAGKLDGAGHTIAPVKGVSYVIANTARLIEATAPSTISNLKIDGKNHVDAEGFGIRGIYTVGKGDVKVENVKIVNCTYSINACNEGKITVVNSTLEGWNSYSNKTEAHFENVKFTEGTYKNFRPYNNTVCVNCDFAKNVVIDLSCMIEGATIKFVNCRVDGKALTTAHLTDAKADAKIAVEVQVNKAPESNAIVSTSASDMTIDGGNLTTTDGKGLRGIFLNGSEGKFTYDNVTVKNVAYAINVNSTKAVELNVADSYLQGWVSYGASTTATFTNVKFAVGSYYANPTTYSSNDNGLFRPYGETLCEGCAFEAGYYIDLGQMAAGKKLTLKNCTYNGVEVTDKNVASVVCFDNYDAAKISVE